MNLWLIKTTCFTSLLLNPVITKTINFKFENLSFTKLPKKEDYWKQILLVRLSIENEGNVTTYSNYEI